MIFIEICSALLEIRPISCEEQGGRGEANAWQSQRKIYQRWAGK